MPLNDVTLAVERIDYLKEDDEKAHGEEKDLWERVLLEIAAGASNAADLAREALKTRDIEFSRWFA